MKNLLYLYILISSPAWSFSAELRNQHRAEVFQNLELKFYPSFLDFGQVRIGTSVMYTVTVMNTGKVEVSHSQARVSGAIAFAVQNLCYGILRPNDSCTISISYRPLYGGYEDAYIHFAADNGSLNHPYVVRGQAY